MSVLTKFGSTVKNYRVPTFADNGKTFVPEASEVVAFSSAAGSNDYFCFPTQVINLNGTLFMFLGLSENHSLPSVGGGNFISKSTDGGLTWSTKIEIVETATYGIGGICFTSTGRILVTCEEYDGAEVRHWFTYSDNASSVADLANAIWSTLARMSTDYSGGILAGPSNPIQLQTAILNAIYADTDTTGPYTNVVYISLNNGDSWTLRGTIYPADTADVEEPCIQALTNNLMISLNRTDALVGIYSSWSPDAGITNSVLRRSFNSVGKPGFCISPNETILAVGRNSLRKNGVLGTVAQAQYNSIFGVCQGRTWEEFPLDTRNGANMYGEPLWSPQANMAIMAYSVERGPEVNNGAADIIVRRFNEVNISDIVVGDLSYETEAQAVINYATRAGFTLPSTAQLNAWNTFIASIKNGAISGANILNKLDFLKVMTHNNANTMNFSCLDIKNPRAFMATRMSPVGTIVYPDFSALGFKTNKINNFLNLNWTANSDKVNLSLNSVSLIVGLSEAPTAGITIGTFKTTGGLSVLQVNIFAGTYGLNDASTAITTSTKTGLFHANRSASNAIQVYRNAASLGTAPTVSVSIPVVGELVVGARSTEVAGTYDQWSDGRCDLIAAGGSLTADEVTDFWNAWAAYKTAIGL